MTNSCSASSPSLKMISPALAERVAIPSPANRPKSTSETALSITPALTISLLESCSLYHGTQRSSINVSLRRVALIQDAESNRNAYDKEPGILQDACAPVRNAASS